MKRVSKNFLVAIFLGTVMMSFSEAQNENCPAALRRLEPCLSQIKRANPTAISSSCCAVVSDILDDCYYGQPPLWLSRAHQICEALNSEPASPIIPSPPALEEPASPPLLSPPQQSTGNEEYCSRFSWPICGMEVVEFGTGRSSSMSDDCCAEVVKHQADCGGAQSGPFVRIEDYCNTHLHQIPSRPAPQEPASPPPQSTEDREYCSRFSWPICGMEVVEFGTGRNSTMSDECCVEVVKHQADCGRAPSGPFVRIEDYCNTHLH